MGSMPRPSNPDREFAAAGQLIKYACMFQWSHDDIEEIVKKNLSTALSWKNYQQSLE